MSLLFWTRVHFNGGGGSQVIQNFEGGEKEGEGGLPDIFFLGKRLGKKEWGQNFRVGLIPWRHYNFEQVNLCWVMSFSHRMFFTFWLILTWISHYSYSPGLYPHRLSKRRKIIFFICKSNKLTTYHCWNTKAEEPKYSNFSRFHFSNATLILLKTKNNLHSD